MSVRDVVLLHGWGASGAVWSALARRLAPRYRVHAPDLPGYGKTPDCPRGSLDAIVESLSGTAPRRCHVVGWSLGGEVALAWARRAPRQVSRLALIATTPCFARRPGWSCATAPATLEEFRSRLTADRGGLLARFVAAQAKGDSRARRVTPALQAAMADDASDAVLASGLEILARADLRGGVRHVPHRALVLHGARDRIVPPAAGRRLAAMLPHARYVPVRSAAHAPFLSQPRRVALLLRAFLDE